MTADPFSQSPGLSQGFNRFAYVWNNPVNLIDPSGYTAEAWNEYYSITSSQLDADGYGFTVTESGYIPHFQVEPNQTVKGSPVITGRTFDFVFPETTAIVSNPFQSKPSFLSNTAMRSAVLSAMTLSSTNNHLMPQSTRLVTRLNDAHRRQINQYYATGSTLNYAALAGIVSESFATYYQKTADTYAKYAPGWKSGINKANRLSRGFSAVGLALEAPIYFEIMGAWKSESISTNQMVTAMVVHSGAIVTKSTFAYVGGLFGTPGGAYGMAVGAVFGAGVGGAFIDPYEDKMLRKLGVRN
jgi:hypothetical protein